MAQLKQTSAETCLDFYDRCTNSIHEAHEEDLSQLVNQPEARDGYQRAIKQTVWQHFLAVLHSDIKAQISAKLQSLDTKEKLLTAVAEFEAAVGSALPRQVPQVSSGDLQTYTAGKGQR